MFVLTHGGRMKDLNNQMLVYIAYDMGYAQSIEIKRLFTGAIGDETTGLIST